MTSKHQISNCDFSVPRRLAGGLSRALRRWQQMACVILREQWATLLEHGVEIELGSIDESLSQRAIADLADPAYAARLLIGPQKLPSLICFPSRLVQVLLGDMLGVSEEGWPEVRELSPAERSLLELLFGEIARSIGQAWPELDTLECELESVIFRPLRGRIYGPGEVLLRTRLNIKTIPGDEEVIWLMPVETLESIGLIGAGGSEPHDVAPSPQLRALAERIPVTMTVHLGSTSLSLSEMNSLAIGDVLLLDQSVERPLVATVDATPHWMGQACRLGGKQGFRIMAATPD